MQITGAVFPEISTKKLQCIRLGSKLGCQYNISITATLQLEKNSSSSRTIKINASVCCCHFGTFWHTIYMLYTVYNKQLKLSFPMSDKVSFSTHAVEVHEQCPEWCCTLCQKSSLPNLPALFACLTTNKNQPPFRRTYFCGGVLHSPLAMKCNLPSCFSAKGDGFGICRFCSSRSAEQLGKQSEKIDGPFRSAALWCAAKYTPRNTWARGNTDAASFWRGPVHT